MLENKYRSIKWMIDPRHPTCYISEAIIDVYYRIKFYAKMPGALLILNYLNGDGTCWIENYKDVEEAMNEVDRRIDKFLSKIM